jgi:tetratricopeptide (TPR) repeat protein
LEMGMGNGMIQTMRIFWVAGFLALVAGGVWGEDKAKVEKKEEPAGLSQEENIKVGRGMAFQAFAAEQAEEWRAARDLYTAAMEKAPEIPWIRLRRGFCLVKLEDMEAARLDFEKAISQGISKDKSDAINDLQSLITLRSKAGPMAEFRDPKGAIALSVRLVELDRNSDNILLQAACLAESEQYMRAQELLVARLREVQEAEEKIRLKEAIEMFRRQSKFGPALEGLELEKEGKFLQAMDRYTMVLDQAPDTAWVLVRRAHCLAKTGDPAGAKADLRRANRLIPETATDRVMLAWAKATCPYLEYRDGAGAVSLAKRALQDEPLIQTYAILAAGYAEMGDFRRAQETVMLALSKGPNPEERKMLEEKLEQFRDKRPRRDEWAPRAESADPA